jgi:hypothetical protein
MPAELLYVPGDSTAMMTPDALAVMLRQGGCGARWRRRTTAR